ncbi:hypothetical protein [Finegoldia magna]|uniref:Uncharacterized protein n=1 Tax=Finegoldia magna BVS033A4 TaxID=866773 RepID=E1KYX6_FINMA|nr:hypothetical protein [Finegoldia magna]EFL53744.1 hypothetical protein HMPREF9289_1656 [Finegoldia magna BVS033A4]MDU1213781.1 hypothetical protein [Finegoldia magna]MDU5272230.1 hypothetical protein [Finegoldia magna]
MDKIKENLNYILLAIVALLVCILALMMFSKKNVYTINTGNSTVLKKNYVVTHYDNKIFMYKNEDLILKKDYDDKKPYYFDGKFLYLIDKKDLLQYNTKGKINSKLSFKSDINYIFANKDHIIIDLENEFSIVSDMKVLESFNLRDEVSSLIASNKSNYALSTIGKRDGRIFSKIYMYDDKGLFYKNIFVDKPIFRMKYVGDNLIVVFDGYIKVFDKANIIKSKSFDGTKNVGISDNNVYVITKTGELLIYDKDLNLVSQSKIDDSLKIYSNDKNCILYNQNGYFIFEDSKLVEYKASDLKSITGEDDFYLIFNNRIERIR